MSLCPESLHQRHTNYLLKAVQVKMYMQTQPENVAVSLTFWEFKAQSGKGRHT